MAYHRAVGSIILLSTVAIVCDATCGRVRFVTRTDKQKLGKAAGCLRHDFLLLKRNPLRTLPEWSNSILATFNMPVITHHSNGLFSTPPKRPPPVYKGLCGNVLAYLSYSKDTMSWVVSSRVGDSPEWVNYAWLHYLLVVPA